MAKRELSNGACSYCGHETTSGRMKKHLRDCTKRQAVIAAANRKAGKPQTLYHLRVTDAYGKAYWLDLEMRGKATLDDLDFYLREIWLECCGHLSRFSLGGWRSSDIDMNKKIDAVFTPGLTLTHIYDFGTSSETLITAVDLREGHPTTKHPIALMARNLLPERQCLKCKEPATWWCPECLYENDEEGVFCDKHIEKHPHEDYGGPVEIVNSPRMGMCGYDGPAEPPY